MKEIQILRKNTARSSDPATKRIIKDPDLKNRKRQRATCSDGITKDPSDFTPIYFSISDFEAESFLQGSSLDLLSTPEICDESPVSSVTNKDFHVDADLFQSIPADLPASVQSLRSEINDLKNMIYSVESSEESNCIHGAITVKFRIVIFAFILWALFAAIVVSVNSGEEIAYSGPLPT